MDKHLSTVSQIDHIDQGLRQFMLGIYNKMTLGLAVTGITAWVAATYLTALIQGPLWILFALLPLGFVLVLSFGLNSLSITAATAIFYLFSISMGLSLSTLFLIYTGTSITKVFFITAATFAAASIYGYTSNKSLSSWGSFLFIGLIGIIIAGLVNIFLASSLLSFIISAVGVIIFVGLTAYDTQNIKNDYTSNGNFYSFDNPEKASIFGALSLYMNFINIFIHLLNLIGDRK